MKEGKHKTPKKEKEKKEKKKRKKGKKSKEPEEAELDGVINETGERITIGKNGATFFCTRLGWERRGYKVQLGCIWVICKGGSGIR